MTVWFRFISTEAFSQSASLEQEQGGIMFEPPSGPGVSLALLLLSTKAAESSKSCSK